MRALVLTVAFSMLGTVAFAAPDPLYVQAVSNPERSARDRERDARDKPADVLALTGIRPGMTVADIFGAGGYYSEMLASIVGPKGKVLLVNNAPYAAYAAEDLKARFPKDRLPNIERTVVESCDLLLGKETLDSAVIVLSYHDLYWADPKGGWPPIDADRVLAQIHAALKPGGTFLVVDHSATPGSGNSAANKLHRIDEAFAKEDIAGHGFVLERTWDGLRNPQDDRAVLVFDDKVRGKTDRFVHLYRKPKKA